MYYVYILRCSDDNNLYIGYTSNLRRRIAEHKKGDVVSTVNRGPVHLEAAIALQNKTKAIELEKYFKTGSGKAFINKRFIIRTD